MDWSFLHDATLSAIHVKWPEGTADFDVIYFVHQMRRRGNIKASGITDLKCPRMFPWGESQSINSISLSMKGSDCLLAIEMQSGDEITVQSKSIGFDEDDPDAK